MSKIATIVALAGLTAAASAQSITLERIATVDASPFMSANSQAASVAWNGTDLFVGEYANANGIYGVTRIGDALTAPTGSRIGDQATAAFRGHFGLDIRGNELAVLHQPTGGGAATNAVVYDATTGAAQYNAGAALNPTGIGGIAFDEVNGGVAFAQFGAGRFRQFDAAGVIWDTASGPFNFDGMWGTAYRGMDMGDDGSIYAREGDQLVKFTRTGADTFMTPFTSSMILNGQMSASTGDNTNGQGVEVADDFGVVFYNDRTNTAGGQTVEDVLKVVGTDGTAYTLNFANSAADFLTNAWLDFSYDPATQTLAVSNFSSNRVNIYRVTPTPGALGVLGFAGLAAARRRRA